MTRSFHKLCLATLGLFCALLPGKAVVAQSATGAIDGTVRDAQSRPVAQVKVSLDDQIEGRTQSATTDASGHFRFNSVAASTYMLRAQKSGFQDAAQGPISLHPGETSSVNVRLVEGPPAQHAIGKSASQAMEYSDEPNFTVAGVSDPSDVGGHGSNVTLPTKEALAKDTAALANEAHLKSGDPKQAEALSAELLKQKDTGDVHALLAEIKEAEGQPVEAAKEYQRAAEMDPSEPHLFSWGAELLLHHAYEPASEVFAKGHRLYPKSIRILVGLGAVAYSQDLHDQAALWFLEASALDPSDPRPYLFLGRVQEVAKSEPPEWVDAFRRFAALQPENARAHYDYAVALEKQRRGSTDFSAREAQLNKAIALDAKFGDAYLHLGLLQAEQHDYVKAAESLQKAVELTPLPDEAHLRLAQVYREMGDTEKAQKESQLYSEVSEKKKDQLQQERRELGQLVYTMQGQTAGPQSSSPKP